MASTWPKVSYDKRKQDILPDRRDDIGTDIALNGDIAMPELSRKRLAELSRMITALIDETELDDDEADAVMNVLLPKLWQRSGLDLFAFHAAVCAALPDLGVVLLPLRRH